MFRLTSIVMKRIIHQMRTVEYVAQRTKEEGYEGRVTVDHLCALASMTDEDASGIIEQDG